MERTQKQITGRAPAPYAWDDKHYERTRNVARNRNAFRVEDVNARRKAEAERRKKEKAKLWLLEIMMVAVVILLLFMVIGKVSSIEKIIDDQEVIIDLNKRLRADINVQNTQLNGLISDDSVSYRAKMELGMIDPDESSVHVLSNVKVNTSDAFTTAGAGSRK